MRTTRPRRRRTRGPRARARRAAAPRRAARSIAQLARATEGAVQLEYTILLVLVCLVAGVATGALGVPLLRLYRYSQTLLMQPFP